MSANVNRRGLSAAILLLVVAACAQTPPDSLLVPRKSVKSFGFSDKKLDETRYLVAFSGPEVTTDNTMENQVAFAARRAEETARDLALARAAQIALARGYPAFAVTSAKSEMKQVIVGHDYRRNGNPVYDNVHGEALGYPTAIYFRPEATLAIELRRQATNGAMDAREVAEKMKRRYAGAASRAIAPHTFYYFGPSAIVHDAGEGGPRREPPGRQEHPPYAGAAY